MHSWCKQWLYCCCKLVFICFVNSTFTKSINRKLAKPAGGKKMIDTFCKGISTELCMCSSFTAAQFTHVPSDDNTNAWKLCEHIYCRAKRRRTGVVGIIQDYCITETFFDHQ